MPSAAKPNLTPKLRFPEFRGELGWEILPLKSACQMQAGKFVQASDIFGKPKEGLFPCYGGNGLRGYTKTFTHSGKYSLIGRQGALCGNVKLVTGDFHATEHAVVATARSGINIDWLFYTLELSNLNQYATGQAQPGLSVEVLDKVSIAFPPKEKEQQKIAECLGTLDELMGAESQKLDALKAHKKGLMQQLFPRAGETRPRLRFPEFQNASEWKSDSLGEIFETSTGGTPSRSTKEYWNGGIPWITTSLVDFCVITEAEEFISAAGLENSSAKLFPQGTVLMALYGQGKTRGQVALLGIEAATNQACAAILPRSDIDPYFVFLNLAGRYEQLRALSNAGGQENLSQGLIREIPFSFPSDEDEQRKVTACLSSLDDLIAAQSDKLAALQTHKQGLIQQLFPSPSEVRP